MQIPDICSLIRPSSILCWEYMEKQGLEQKPRYTSYFCKFHQFLKWYESYKWMQPCVNILKVVFFFSFAFTLVYLLFLQILWTFVSLPLFQIAFPGYLLVMVIFDVSMSEGSWMSVEYVLYLVLSLHRDTLGMVLLSSPCSDVYLVYCTRSSNRR